MAITSAQRRWLVDAARSYDGIRYDTGHGDLSWRSLDLNPTRFDCATFVCRVALEVIGHVPDLLAADARWLAENLVAVPSPQLGDVVGYRRRATGVESQMGHDVVWHVMLYLGNGSVIGACDVAGAVAIRPIDYEASLGSRQWKFARPSPFRMISVAG